MILPLIIVILWQKIAFVIIALIIYFLILVWLEKLKLDNKTKKILFYAVVALYVSLISVLSGMLGGIDPEIRFYSPD